MELNPSGVPGSIIMKIPPGTSLSNNNAAAAIQDVTSGNSVAVYVKRAKSNFPPVVDESILLLWLVLVEGVVEGVVDTSDGDRLLLKVIRGVDNRFGSLLVHPSIRFREHSRIGWDGSIAWTHSIESSNRSIAATVEPPQPIPNSKIRFGFHLVAGGFVFVGGGVADAVVVALGVAWAV